MTIDEYECLQVQIKSKVPHQILMQKCNDFICNEMNNGFFPGVIAFKLFIECGMPFEITDDLARRTGFKNGVNRIEFNRLNDRHRLSGLVSRSKLFTC